MAVKEVQPVVEKSYQVQVDKMIEMELTNMRAMLNINGGKTKKKKKKGAKKKKKKGNKIKMPKLPGARGLKGMDS